MSELYDIFTNVRAIVTVIAIISFLAIALPRIDYIGDHPMEAIEVSKDLIVDTVKEIAGPEAIRAEIFWILAGATLTVIAGIITFLRKFS